MIPIPQQYAVVSGEQEAAKGPVTEIMVTIWVTESQTAPLHTSNFTGYVPALEKACTGFCSDE